MSYQYLTGGYGSYSIVQSTLPNSAPGEENIVTFTQALPDALIAMIQKGDVPAIIGCKDQRGEIVKVKRGSYVSATRNARIIRATSRWANNVGDTSTINFNQPNTLVLNFAIIVPGMLQDVNDRLNVLEGTDDLFFNSRLPVGTTSQKGTYKSAYRPTNQISTEAQSVVTNDAPAHQELYKSIFGATSPTYINLIPRPEELVRLGLLRGFLDYLSFNPARLEALKKIIDKEISNPSV